ncbi:hypothetical protein BOTBODRAFT_432510 [Botryobasidium botryosum FD-172 SS1]|uniref:MYND-type domain-containing protein n=1 Tax=Botryobasidium botryosum (strain FD-172 SS1) TaxID=930990 RepID=A0A067MJ97_BOTB1|nr:hypothetical protein BOTBODRAFT_432510 [Botryobasidium botryosum FD-172 SS1]
MSSKLSKPLLPAELIADVQRKPCMANYTSAVFEENLHNHRVGCCNWNAPSSPDSVAAFRGEVGVATGFTMEAGRTHLHLAATEGDVLAACELIRLGASVDALDSGGLTPLALAAGAISKVAAVIATLLAVEARAEAEMVLKRFIWVARVLIEQHADVDQKENGCSILEIACSVRSWELVKLLLKHKAKPSQKCHSYFHSRSDKDRFISIASSYASNPRPERVCPCWSGKTLAQCHGATAQPYPLPFLCVCGSKKKYQKCCYERSAWVTEKWAEDDQRLQQSFSSAPTVADYVTSDKFQAMQAVMEKLAKTNGLSLPTLCQSTVRAEARETSLGLLASLVPSGRIDPAYFYACKQVDFFPRPYARKHSKLLCEDMQLRWNAAVDKYILRGGDSRSRFEIERAAKIGRWNGALIQTCEGVGCTKVENVEGTVLRKCSRCKISVYCSQQCQRSAWPAHKAICLSDDQHEQMLPSQLVVKTIADAPFKDPAGVFSCL